MKRLLIVEDTETGRALLRAWIEAASRQANKPLPQIREAKNGPEGRREVLTHRPDLVILDAVLPGESAEELGKYLQTLGIPWIWVSAASDPAPHAPKRLVKPDWDSLDGRALELAHLLWP